MLYLPNLSGISYPPTLLTCTHVSLLCPSHRLLGVAMLHQATASVLTVSSGYYSGPETDNATLRYSQTVCPVGYYCSLGVRIPCPPGSYGNTTGLSSSSCSGPCAPGYYCTIGSTSSTQFPCGNASVYCPSGSSTPLVATPGQLTVGGTPTNRSGTVMCDSSQYCVNGTTFPCPPGRFGCATGLGSPDCNGPCAQGFYCPAGSDSNHATPCGNASVYCPEGSGLPLPVAIGYYSLGGPSLEQQSQQAVCPSGSYCVNGTMVCVCARM